MTLGTAASNSTRKVKTFESFAGASSAKNIAAPKANDIGGNTPGEVKKMIDEVRSAKKANDEGLAAEKDRIDLSAVDANSTLAGDQAFIFIGSVLVDPVTLVGMIAAAFLGAFFGAKLVSSWSRHYIRLGMGSALLAGAALFAAKNLGYIASKGEASGVEGGMLVVAVVGNLILGALMTIGIGLYAPCMLLVSFIGMNERAAFPIMMGSCAFLMTGATKPFVDKGSYSLKSALGLAVGGVPAVLIAAYIVKSLPLETLRWGVAAVVLYTGIAMLRSAMVEAKK